MRGNVNLEPLKVCQPSMNILQHSFACFVCYLLVMVATYRAAYRLLPDIIGYFLYSYKIHEIPGGKNVWK